MLPPTPPGAARSTRRAASPDALPPRRSLSGDDTEPRAPYDAEPGPVVAEARSSRLPLVLATVRAVLVLGAALAAPLVDQALRGEEQVQRALDLTLVETWEITDRAHTTDDVTYPQTRPPAVSTRRSGWPAVSTTSRCATRTPSTTSSTARCGSPTTPRCRRTTSRRWRPSSPTTGSCRRVKACPHRSWSPCGAPSSSSTAPTTRGSDSSSRSTATGTPRRSSASPARAARPIPPAHCRRRA